MVNLKEEIEKHKASKNSNEPEKDKDEIREKKKGERELKIIAKKFGGEIRTETKIPKQLQNEEFRFVLLGKWDEWKNVKTKEIKIFSSEDYKSINKNIWKPLGKTPFEPKWQNKGYKFDDPKLLAHINKGLNFGVIGGYGNLCIVDIDDPELAKKLENNFDTFTIETGSGGKHFYFILENEE